MDKQKELEKIIKELIEIRTDLLGLLPNDIRWEIEHKLQAVCLKLIDIKWNLEKKD